MRQGIYTVRPSRIQRFKAGTHRRWRWFKDLSKKQKAALIGGPIAGFLILVPILTYIYFANVIGNPQRLMNRNDTGVVLEDKSGKPFYSFGKAGNEKLVPLSQISDSAEKALVSAEDKNFYTNPGFSVKSILGAVYGNLIAHDATAYGGSGLTQQLVKNTLLTNNKSFLRKYQEVFLAVAVNQHYSKDQILDMYLNSVYFGENAFGIKDAARTYFNTTPDKLTLAQSSMLIGLLPAPNAYSPVVGSATLAKERQTYVLKRMTEDGKITNGQETAALGVKLAYAPPKKVETAAPFFSQMVLNELYNKYGQEKVDRSGLVVKTTLDLDWQKAANQYVANQTNLTAAIGGDDGALVAQDPKTGEIRALVGSSDYNNPQFGKVNMATTPRQPGSSFKPIYYTEAMARGLITPSTHILDAPIDIDGYAPHNFDYSYHGSVTTRFALSNSLNIPSVKIMQKLGVQNAINTANRMGISTINRSASDYGLPLALGTGEAKLTDMVNAYSAFADQGQQYKQTKILSIQDKYDKQIYKYQPESKQVVDQGAAFLISSILSDNQARSSTFGSSLTLSRAAAVKTGSTENDVDAWTIGYTPNAVVGVWVGNNEHKPMGAGGVDAAGPIWVNMMERIFQDLPQENFDKPATVDQTRVCSSNGGKVIGDGTAGTYLEYFLSDSPPQGSCNKQQPKDSDNDGVNDDKDNCPDTASGVKVDKNGCEVKQPKDSDNDGVNDDKDNCPDTASGVKVDKNGCEVQSQPAIDSDNDGDGVPDTADQCPATLPGESVNTDGCSPRQLNSGNGNGGGNF